ncbi:cysteine desulfurase [Akkermansiaceae bacterium]|nr:cysteine desulfurase [Akkermansiaceae bacterium]MDA7624319.1 cysteine desulfurase [Akkermansiaceae bacterium]MDA7927438.1 cysteine desulfurase [Akkermansiaceae bacterium]MDB4375758.1 cysteine desulfurase [Akkermansiaceae bacterium]MDB4434695.1 cysteine desulfurase [Akkermansiaceae bacterium]
MRSDFPILSQEINGKPLVYLDNAATSQKPLSVLDSSRDYYEKINSNIHRGVHKLSQAATAAHETARDTIARHLNANRPEEIIFTSGTTDSINLVASALGRSDLLKAGDEIIISGLEHHSNTVPWQMLCERLGITLKIIPVLDDGTLDLEIFDQLLSEKTKLVSVNHVSNAFGTVNNIAHICSQAKKVGALTFVDGAQSVPHFSIDLQLLDCDFYAFSGHKVYGPTGVGVLFGKYDLLCELPPWRGGGEMIKEVTFEKTTYNEPPFKFEAGTPNIEGGIALATAFCYVNNLGITEIANHEEKLIRRTAEILADFKNITLYGPGDRIGAISFNFDGIHHYDLGTLLDQMGFALRTGHHCCQPLMARFGVTGTLRASFAAYNTLEEVESFGEALQKALMMLR